MALIKYIQHNGNEHEADVAEGSSVMQGAVDNGIDGILAECGGACSCATCHVYVDEAWIDKIPAADDFPVPELRRAQVRGHGSTDGQQFRSTSQSAAAGPAG